MYHLNKDENPEHTKRVNCPRFTWPWSTGHSYLAYRSVQFALWLLHASRDFWTRLHLLPKPDILTFSEIKEVVVVFAASGGKKVRLTGGEPLLRPDVAKLVRSLRSIDEIDEIALTTNGLLLSKCASELKIAGLNRVTISLDAIDDATFRKMSGRDISVQKVLDGIACAEDAGLDVKINAVIIRGQNEDQVIPLAEHFRNTPTYCGT